MHARSSTPSKTSVDSNLDFAFVENCVSSTRAPPCIRKAELLFIPCHQNHSSASDKASRSVSAATPSLHSTASTSRQRSILRTLPSPTQNKDDSVELIDLGSPPKSVSDRIDTDFEIVEQVWSLNLFRHVYFFATMHTDARRITNICGLLLLLFYGRIPFVLAGLNLLTQLSDRIHHFTASNSVHVRKIG